MSKRIDNQNRKSVEMLAGAIAFLVLVLVVYSALSPIMKVGKTSVEAATETPPAGVVNRSVSYGPDTKHRATLCYKQDLSGKNPGVMLFHGGGGSIRDMIRVCNELALKGYVAASVDYRQEPYGYPYAVEDAWRAFAMFAKIDLVDPSRVGTWGGSAGGWLASILGTQTPGDRTLLYRSRCVLNNFGPTDWSDPEIRESTVRGGVTVADGVFGGVTFSEDPALYRKASPVWHASSDDGRFAYTRSVNDRLVPRSQYLRFKTALGRQGKTLPVFEYNGTGGGHANDVTPEVSRQIWEFQTNFMDGCLK